MKELKPIKDIEITKNSSLYNVAKQYYESGGFVAKKIGIGVQILKDMFAEDELKILSFPACIISTRTRGIIKDLIKKKMFDLVMATCGTLDHDLARAYKDYYHGHQSRPHRYVFG